MSAHVNGGSPVASPQQYQTVPTAIITQAEQHDRALKPSELNILADYFRSGHKRIQIASVITQHASAIVAAGAERIFFGGAPMAFLETVPHNPTSPSAPLRKRAVAVEKLRVQAASAGNPVGWVFVFLKAQFLEGRDPLPSGFRPIHIARYGPKRMQRSMRDLSWFLRYVAYAIVAGDSSILSVNVRGLRGVIPEDVTLATLVAIRDMQWKILSYFQDDPEANRLIQECFDTLVADYLVEKPSHRLRQGVANDQQGLQLPESYVLAAAPRAKFVIRQGQSVTDQQEAIKAAYRQVFERDITRVYGFSLTDLESKVQSGEISTKEFVRRLGKSRLYRREFYEPFVISRVVELAARHFLGRGLSSMAEFQHYFSVISQGGLPALVDALVDSSEYSDYFGEETVPYLRGLGIEAQECRNWGPQHEVFQFKAVARKAPQFVTLFGDYRKPLPNQHPYGMGNDPLEIQFGAIFPHQNQRRNEHPARFERDHRRILVSCEAEVRTGTQSQALSFGGHRILKFNPPTHQPNKGKPAQQGVSVSLTNNSPTAVIQGAYRQVFGRDVYEGQRLAIAELKLQGGKITVRDFVRQLAQSRLFRSLYWDNLYITKAIEYIHRRLLGRPTHGRQELEHYYDTCARKGFYALIDQILNSPEYLAVFGDQIVPYERYITPKGFEMRSRKHLANPLPQTLANQAVPFQTAWDAMMWESSHRSVHLASGANNGADQEPEPDALVQLCVSGAEQSE
jgi:phycobilisome core-membrane linker protein